MTDRDRGEPRGSAPPTPPYVRVRIRRFGGLSAGLGAHGGQTKRPEEGFGERKGESGAVAEPPGAMRGAGGLCRQGAPDPSRRSSANRVRPRFHCCQAIARRRRLI